MKLYKKILIGVLIVFIAIQFIQPDKNRSGELLATDITKTCHKPSHWLNVSIPWIVGCVAMAVITFIF